MRSKRPSVAVDRYGAIGSVSCQTQVVRPWAVTCETSTPLAITVSPAGTLTLKSYVALSRGLSFAGYQRRRALRLSDDERAVVGRDPASIEKSGSVTTVGVPA